MQHLKTAVGAKGYTRQDIQSSQINTLLTFQTFAEPQDGFLEIDDKQIHDY